MGGLCLTLGCKNYCTRSRTSEDARDFSGRARLTTKFNVLTTVPLIAQKELRLGGWIPDRTLSPNTMRNERKRWGLKPADYDGNQPLFKAEDVAAAKERRLKALNKRFGVPAQ